MGLCNMINLYSPENTDFTKNGNATLQAIRCDLSVTINGAWQLELEIPYDKEGRWKLVEEGAVVQVNVDCIREISNRQRFRIYDYRKTEDSVIAIAFPVAMESTHDAPIDNLIIEDKTGVEAMALLQGFTNKYTLSTDITRRGSANYGNTNVNNAIASGDDNSFIKEWGGEIAYDNLNYKVRDRLGSTSDIEPVTYGRNITAIKYERDDSGVVTRLHPISTDGLRLDVDGHDYVDSPRVSDYPIIKSRYIQAPYQLIDTKTEFPTRTVNFTSALIADIVAKASALSHTAYTNALANNYEVEYIKAHQGEIVSAIQQMCTGTMVMASLQSVCNKAISQGMAWLKSIEKPDYTWHGSYELRWTYGNDTNSAIDQYIYSYQYSKWYSFDSTGSLIGEPDSETITLLNTYSWHTDNVGQYYGDGNGNYLADCWIENSDGTHSWVDSAGYWDSTREDTTPWEWTSSGGSWWYGYDDDWKVKGQWAEIGNTWNKFDDNGYWIESSAHKNDPWDWYQPVGAGGLKYGNFDRWYARDEWVYEYVGDVLWCYWIDAGGWYKSVSEYKMESTWTWHESETGKWWFGAEGATAEDPDSFAHDEWVYINGYRYFFDHDGYNYDILGYDKEACSWHWITTDNYWWWLGDENHETNAIYLTDQWAEIDGNWRQFDANGYVVDEDTAVTNLINLFKTQMANIETVVTDWKDDAYDLLYDLMTEYCEKQFATGIDVPVVNISVDMLDLSKTSEYKDYQGLAKIRLGDTVVTRDYEHDIEANERVVGLTYDCIRGYNSKVEIGVASSTFADLLKTDAGGKAVVGGFDTSAIENNLEAFRAELGSLDARKQDKLTAGAHINITGNVISTDGAGLKYWVDTSERFYRNISRRGLNGVHVYKNVSWTNYVSGLYTGYEYKKANTEDAAVGVLGNQLNKHICLVSIYPDAVKWVWRDRGSSGAYQSMDDYSANMFNVTFDYDNITWYASVITVLHGSSASGTVTGITNVDSSYVMQDETEAGAINLAKRFIDVEHMSNVVTYTTEIGVKKYVLRYGNSRDAITFIDINGNGKFTEITTDAGTLTAQMARKQDKLIQGNNIILNGATISAVDTTYSAGTNVQINSDNEISATDTTYEPFTGADGSNDGAEGLVPKPMAGDHTKFLKGDGTWASIGGGGGGSTISYGTAIPTSSGNDGDLYFRLDSNDQRIGTYLYIYNQWVMIEGQSSGGEVTSSVMAYYNHGSITDIGLEGEVDNE